MDKSKGSEKNLGAVHYGWYKKERYFFLSFPLIMSYNPGCVEHFKLTIYLNKKVS